MAKKTDNTKMKRLGSCHILLVLLFIFAPVASGAKHKMWYSARVIAVIDGDTIQIKNKTGKRIIRLWGIDTPESDQPYSLSAKKMLRDLILNKEVDIRHLYIDDFQRSVAEVRYEGSSVHSQLVKAGYAWVHPVYCRKPVCLQWKKEERKAKKNKYGLWQDDNPTSPWQWKWQNRQKRR